MKLSALVAATLVALSSLASADVSVVENHETVAIDCAKDKIVSLVGNHITATLTGTCTKVSVAGNFNTVTGSANSVWLAGNHNTAALDHVDELMVPGNYNTATYKGPVSAKATKVSNPGTKNTITQQK
ncbi:MAG: DUF3060 domain-containing protein [Myxococcales bacterium]|nr:DUF3060 domain-containing protein [Myxococcales bacterium]